MVCCVDVPRAGEVACDRAVKEHSMCRSCFCEMVRVQASDMTDFTTNGRRIACLACRGGHPKHLALYPEVVIYSNCSYDKIAIATYIDAVRKADRMEEHSKARAREERLERRKEEVMLEGELKLYEHNEREKLNAIAKLHRFRIIDLFLTPKCPHCERVFASWSNCFAVKCSSEYRDKHGSMQHIGCQGYFCGWCLETFKDGCACRDHVAACPKSLNPGNSYGANPNNPTDEFNRAQVAERTRRIQGYLAAQGGLSPKEMQAVLDSMRKADLDPLGIDL